MIRFTEEQRAVQAMVRAPARESEEALLDHPSGFTPKPATRRSRSPSASASRGCSRDIVFGTFFAVHATGRVSAALLTAAAASRLGASIALVAARRFRTEA